MGKPDVMMQSYLCDKERFADLFNGVFFQGKQIVKACCLQDSSERYSETERQGKNATTRLRDIKMTETLKVPASLGMTLSSGERLRVLAVENQSNIDYIMPYRCMQYDVMEYGRQLKELKAYQKKHREKETPAERLCGISKSDRLVPVYTLCLYHGEQPWDGPMSLRDMVAFGRNNDKMEQYFIDYPLRMFCVNEAENFEMFHTELRELFGALKYRSNRNRLQALFLEDKRYRRLSADTAEALSVLLNIPRLQDKWRDYMQKNQEEEAYNMCQAWKEIEAECIAKGKEEGRAEGIAEDKTLIARNMLKHGFSDEEICELTECTAEFIGQLRLRA